MNYIENKKVVVRSRNMKYLYVVIFPYYYKTFYISKIKIINNIIFV